MLTVCGDQRNVKTIDRPVLFKRFEAGLQRKLTLVEAPVGYGKTTLLKAWEVKVTERGFHTAYLSIEQGAEEATRQIERAILRLVPRTPDRPAYDRQITLGYRGDDDPRQLLHEVAQTLETLAAPACLFIDDFHESSDAEVDVVRLILQHPASHLHIVIGSREPPAFPLAKLRLAGEVTDFGIEDLRFSRADTGRLFDGALTDDVLDSYQTYAEGWVAALQLLRLSALELVRFPLDEASAFGQRSEMSNYLNEQYFLQLSDEQRSFFLDTAHLASINGDLADHVRQRCDSWDLLDGLAQSHALVFEEPERSGNWFRYHQLLRDFLEQKQVQRGEAILSFLHERAAAWLNDHGQLQAAIQHAIRAGKPELSVSMLLAAGGVQIGFHEGAPRLAACLEQIPLEQINASSRLAIARAYLLLKRARIQEGALLIDEVRSVADVNDKELARELVMVEAHLRLYEDQPLTDAQISALDYTARQVPASDRIMRGLLYNILCIFLLQTGRLDEARTAGETAMALFQDIDAAHLQFFMHIHLSSIDLEFGHYRKAFEGRKAARDLCYRQFSLDPSLKAIADGYFGEAAYELGDIDGLEAIVARALDHADKNEGWGEFYLAGYETCLTLSYVDHGYAAAVEHVERAEAMVVRRGMRRFSRHMTILQFDLAVRAGAESEAVRLVTIVQGLLDEKQDERALRWRGRIMAEMALARFEARFGDPASAIDRLEQLSIDCQDDGKARYALRVEVRKTIVAAQMEDRDRARISLQNALSTAGRQRCLGAFLREEGEFAEAARWIVRQSGIAHFSHQEVSFLADVLWRITGSSDARRAGILHDLLTEKEHAVVTLLADGHANKVIARHLDLTEPTIKFHLQNIYRKMGVNSRKMAADLARRYGEEGTG